MRKTKDAECDGQFSESQYDEQLEVGNVKSDGHHEMVNTEYDRQPDMGDSEYEMELGNNDCDEMRDIECKESNDE